MKNISESSAIYIDPYWLNFKKTDVIPFHLMAITYVIYLLVGVPANVIVIVYYYK
jgi:hypothetical protein